MGSFGGLDLLLMLLLLLLMHLFPTLVCEFVAKEAVELEEGHGSLLRIKNEPLDLYKEVLLLFIITLRLIMTSC